MFRKRRIAAAVAISMSFTPAYAGMDVSTVAAKIQADIARRYPGLEALYRDIHQHPELSFQETRTAGRLADEMQKLGFEVTEKVGGTGVVALFRNGDGPTVMLRTELDALPMEEKTGLDYASHAKAVWNDRETFVAHACGHDIHMTVWVGVAQQLVAMKDRWHGTLMFVAQPAEEIISGAKAMLDDGLFTRFPKPDVAFALHVAPFSNDEISFAPGVRTANSDPVEIIFHGRGGHGSMPDKTIDPIVIASRFVTDIQTAVSREKKSTEFGVITLGSFQAGTTGNIVPDQARLQGSIYTYSLDVRAKLLAAVSRVAKAAADMSDAPPPEIIFKKSVRGVINDAELTTRTGKVLHEAFGNKVRISPPTTAAEDYSEFVNAGVPSMFFGLGAYAPERVAAFRAGKAPPPPPNHSPAFAPVPKPTIGLGITTLSLAVLSTLGDSHP